jgi:hypothetical protein
MEQWFFVEGKTFVFSVREADTVCKRYNILGLYWVSGFFIQWAFFFFCK